MARARVHLSLGQCGAGAIIRAKWRTRTGARPSGCVRCSQSDYFYRPIALLAQRLWPAHVLRRLSTRRDAVQDQEGSIKEYLEKNVDFLERIRKFLAKYGAQLNSFVVETKCARFPFRITDIIRAAASSRS